MTTIKPDGIIAFDLLGTFSVSCDYVGLPVPTVQWFHNNTLLDVTDPNIIIFNSSDTTSVVTQITTELTRINSSYEVGGDYICQLSNELGSVAASVIIARILSKNEHISYLHAWGAGLPLTLLPPLMNPCSRQRVLFISGKFNGI